METIFIPKFRTLSQQVQFLTDNYNNLVEALNIFETTFNEEIKTLEPLIESMDSLLALEGQFETLQGQFSQLSSKVDTFESSIEQANSTATTAKQTAIEAQQTATEAQQTANSVQQTATNAQSTADTAQQTATTAKSTADTARQTAQNALDKSNQNTSSIDDIKSTLNSTIISKKSRLNVVGQSSYIEFISFYLNNIVPTFLYTVIIINATVGDILSVTFNPNDYNLDGTTYFSKYMNDSNSTSKIEIDIMGMKGLITSNFTGVSSTIQAEYSTISFISNTIKVN